MSGAAHGLRQGLALALIGLQFALFEALRLVRGGIVPGSNGFLEIAVGHVLLALVLGLPLAVVAVALLPRSGRRRWRPILAPFGVLLIFTGVVVNVVALPGVLDPMSLVADALIVIAFAALALLFVRRPWSQRADRALVGGVLVLDLVVGGYVLGAGRLPMGDEQPERAQGERGPDLILVLLDTLRADHLGAYGYERDTSPEIDDLAASGLVFERAFSTTNWTRPAVASLFTSTMPSRHGMIADGRGVPRELPLLAEVLSDGGYQTAFFTVGINVQPEDGYARGLEHFYYSNRRSVVASTFLFGSFVFRYVPFAKRLFDGSVEDLAHGDPAKITDAALDWLDEADADRPVFTYLHYLGPHSPYQPPHPHDDHYGRSPPVERLKEPPSDKWAGEDALSEADRRQMIDQYDGEIRWHDDEMRRLVDGLRERGRLDDYVLAITADHGEGFGEHGVWAHGSGMFDDVVRIPLIFLGSPNRVVPGVTRAAASLLDVAPTFVELAGAERPTTFDGESLVAWLRGQGSEEREVFIENPLSPEFSLRNEDWAYLESETKQGRRSWLYRADDLEQRDDLSHERPGVVAELRERILARRVRDTERQAVPVEVELDEDRADLLRALGYLEE